MRTIKLIAVSLLAIGAAFAQVPNKMSVVDSLDKSVDPCVDFYQYACGGWRKANPLPPERSRYDRFDELSERNTAILKEVLEASAKGGTSRNANQQKIGDFYSACMDESGIEKKGITPLKADLDSVANLKTVADITPLIVDRHRKTIPGFFRFSSEQDAKDASKIIAGFGQGGLGLPSRDYYIEEDARSKEIREKYVAHVANMFKLAGESADQATADAKTVMEIETILAKGSLNREEMRDPKKLYNPMTIAELQKLAPSFDFAKYVSSVGAPKVTTVNVNVPKYMGALETVLSTRKLDDIKAYLRWHIIRDGAPLLPAAFVNEQFEFNSKFLRGQQQIRPRWKRCVEFTDAALGEALGMEYVKRTFGEDGKKRMLEMVHNLEAALKEDIQSLDWMSPATKTKALEKLSIIENKIGYPDKPRDYSAVKIVAGDALGNAERASTFEFLRQLNKIGKPLDKSEWQMTPPEVNAYFDPQQNNINFPAGILQPPFFDKTLDDALNYGATGMVIGHELTHGFDDEGAQFDAKGNLADWWTKEDKAKFDERTSCMATQYSNFDVYPDLKANGKLTLGENVADNGGMKIAYMALMKTLAGKPQQKIDGFTPQQRLFLGFAQIWCSNQSEQSARLQTKTNEHSLNEFRVKGTIVNSDQFREAFGCKVGQPMAPEKTCKIW